MLILDALLGLKSKQGDFTAAFIHEDIPKYEKVYIEIPRGFEQSSKNGHKKNFKLKNTLYGICQSTRAF